MTGVGIVNRVLRLLGVPTPATSMADASPASVVSAITAYPLCRDEVLRLLPWPSCVRRIVMKNWIDQATPWTASTEYFPGDRCTNDTAKTYQCIIAGISAAATGPTGTSSGITDGTVTWNYKEASTTVNNWCWVINTDYVLNDIVSNDTGKVYVCITAGTSAGAGGPTGTAVDIADGTVHWRYYGSPGRNLTVYSQTYILPSECLRVLKIPNLVALTEQQQGVQYIYENHWLYCDQEGSVLRFVKQELDPDGWDDLLQWTICFKIAAEIAFEVTGQPKKVDKMFERFAGSYQTARHAAMSEGTEAIPEPILWTEV